MKDTSQLLFELLYDQQEQFPQEVAFTGKEVGQWRTYSTAESIELSKRIGYALINAGMQPDDKVALVSNNRSEWCLMDLGMLQAGVINVPVYPTISEDDYKFIFHHAGVKLCFVSDAELYQKISNIQAEVPSLQAVYTFDAVPGAKHFDDFLKLGDEAQEDKLEKRKAAISEDDVATIIYTSGTTGTPKGVMLSHGNIMSNIKSVGKLLPIDHTHRALSFLPLCHSFERAVYYNYLANGVSIYFAESLDTIGDNLKEVKPHYFSTVPRLLEKVYEKIMAKGAELTGFKRKLFFWSIDLGLQYEPEQSMGLWYNIKLAIARRLVFSKWREALGGEVEAIVTGAAAMQPRLAKLFAAAGITILEGYGMTETSPVIACNRMEPENMRIGTVGLPIPGIEVKIAEDGEILTRGPHVMKGYYKRPDLTAEVIDEEGWMHTGDVGEFVDGKFLKITDRKKELFKTSGGKYIAPQAIENKMKESRYIEQLMVVGENRKFITALVVPSFANLMDWCAQQGINSSSQEELVQHPQVMKVLEQEVEQYNRHFGRWEQVKKIRLMPNEWSVDTGELTPTMKVKRKIILEKYAGLIQDLYEASEAEHQQEEL